MYLVWEFSKRAVALALLATVASAQSSDHFNFDAASEHPSPQRRGGFNQPARGVYKSQVTPHWLPGNTRFWYRNDLRDGAKEFILVDAEKGTRRPAFDHRKLAAALSKSAGQEYAADKLPFSEIEFVQDGNAIQFDVSGKSWKCDLKSYECVAAAPSSARSSPFVPAESFAVEEVDTDLMASSAVEELSPQADEQSGQAQADQAQTGQRRGQRQGQNQDQNQNQNQNQGQRRGQSGRQVRSPDGKWQAFVRESNVFVRGEDGSEVQLSQDGKEDNAYGLLEWSPDSKVVVGWRIESAERKEVYRVQSSPAGGGRALLRQQRYALPGDKFPQHELNLFDVATRKQTKPQVDRFEHEWETPRLHWTTDRRHFAWSQEDRGHQRLRVIEVDSQTGAARNLVDEKTATFIWTAHTENLGNNFRQVNWLTKSDDFIYVSEMDGWRHFYLVDGKEGKIRNQITKGEWVVRGIDRIDEEERKIWFRAGGMNPKQDPYFVHYYRVNFDGSGFVALTEGDGHHSVQYSPDRKYLIDTYSRVDTPPVNELRRVADGKRVCELESADIEELKQSGWQAPEIFVAKGRDGKTDIWGVINRPRNLDPNKKYPVLESIYSGPQGAYVPKSFSGTRRNDALNEAGFITVQVDGMGTAFRSKAFHDVCWKNLKDAGFEDRILWHKAIAKKYPYYDVTRVGIYGGSAGGQNAAAAVIFHPEFYKAAVANSGCHDNRMDKASWNEQWMGYPVGLQYSECSNIDNAEKLRGRLSLVVGEMDDNVPPETTLRFVDALIRARKDFDLLVVPNAGHGAGSPVTQRRLQDFFMRHLQGIEPPNRNAES
jgi:dipeptidyl aminopeptidase/acylaminoacyl peptidase